MPIDFLCGQCQHTLRVPEESAGKKARCPQCGHVQAIPEAAPEPGGAGFDVGQFDQSSGGGPSGMTPSGSSPSGYGAGAPYQSSNQETPYQSYSEPASQYRPNPYQSPSGPGYYAPQPKSLEQVCARVRPPAIALMVVAGLCALMALLWVFIGVMAITENGNPDEGDAFMLAFFIGMFIAQLVIIIGAARMMVLKNYGFAITVAILSLMTGVCCQLLMPFGIWALVILCDSDTRSHFS